MKTSEVDTTSKERATIVPSWREYLFLTRISKTEFKLAIMGHPMICEATEYMNDDGEYDLPEEIDGVKVWGVEGEWILSEELVECEQYRAVQFQTTEDPQLLKWLDEYGWDLEDVRQTYLSLECEGEGRIVEPAPQERRSERTVDQTYSDLEKWLANKKLGDDLTLPPLPESYTNVGLKHEQLDGEARRILFLDACLSAIRGDRHLQGGDDGRKDLERARRELERLQKALDSVLNDPNARSHLEMAGWEDSEKLKDSLGRAKASTTLPRGGQQARVDVSVRFIAHAWKHYFRVEPRPSKGSQFYDFIDQLTEMDLTRTISETILRRVLS